MIETSATSSRRPRWLNALDLRALIPFCTRVATGALSYGIFALAARATDQQTFNLFAFIFSLVHIIGPLAVFGQTSVALKYLPLLDVTDFGTIAAQMFAGLRRVFAGVVLALGIVVMILSVRVPDSGVIAIVCAIVAVFALNDYLSASSRGLGSIAGAILSRDVIWRVILFVTLAVAVLFGNEKVQLLSLVSSLFAGFLVALAALAYLLLPVLRARRAGVPIHTSPALEWVFFIGLTGIDLWFVNADVIILNMFNFDAGSYFSAQRTTALLIMISVSMLFVVSTRITQAFHVGNLAEIEKISRDLARSAGMFVGLAVLAMLFFSPRIMAVFGARFVKDAYLLNILSISPLIHSLGGLHALVPVMCGLQRSYFFAVLTVVGVASIGKLGLAGAGQIGYFAALNLIESCLFVGTGILLSRRAGIRLTGPL
jgi:O-antigen/teichoic acid export membrane protein